MTGRLAPYDADIRLTAYGTGLRGSGYPNGANTLRTLRRLTDWQVVDRVDWLPEGLHLWRIARGPWRVRITILSRLIIRGVFQALRLQLAGRAPNTLAYVPYPSLFTLYWLSWMPRRLRQKIVTDAYISVWDSMFRDRADDKRKSLGSRILHHVEGRALRTADKVLVDSQANAEQMAKDFRLDPDRVHSLPLAIDETPFLSIQPRDEAAEHRVRVLFVGTMIPLHGIGVVLEAIHALRHDLRIEFRLVGDGQLGDLIEDALQNCDNPRVTWLRGWQSLDVIAREIADADICLGVFGGANKASRVLPFKLYMYFAAGRAVISQESLSAPAGVPYPPIEAIDPFSADGLSAAILTLVNSTGLRKERSSASREYYQQWISAAQLSNTWVDLCSRLGPGG